MFISIIVIQDNVYSYPAKIFTSLHLRQNDEETFPHGYFTLLNKTYSLIQKKF